MATNMVREFCRQERSPMGNIFDRSVCAGGNGEREEFKCWKSLRSIIELMIPCCGCLRPVAPSVLAECTVRPQVGNDTSNPSPVTGTIFGNRKGRVNLCIQDGPGSPPLVILEFSTPTHVLAKQMQSDHLRIVLECEKDANARHGDRNLFSEPVWIMFCNGRKVGFAIKKQSFCTDRNAIELMQSTSMGAGVIPVEEGRSDEEDLVYMRAHYHRVVGSVDSQAFHMINPDFSSAQELSIFFLRT